MAKNNYEGSYGLTSGQSDLLVFIQLYYKQHGIYPSFREMMKGHIDGRKVIKERNTQVASRKFCFNWSSVEELEGCLEKKEQLKFFNQ